MWLFFSYFSHMKASTLTSLIWILVWSLYTTDALSQTHSTVWKQIHQQYRDGNYAAAWESLKQQSDHPITAAAKKLISYQRSPTPYIHANDTLSAIIGELMNLTADSLRNTWLIRAYSARYHLEAETNGMNKALQIAEQALRIPTLEQAWIADYTDFIYDVGYLYSQVGRHVESASYYRRAAARYEADPNTPPSSLALCYNNLAYSYSEIGLYQLVIEHYRKAHELWWQKEPANLTYNATALQNLIREVTSYGDYQEADSLLQKFTPYYAYWTTHNKWTIDSMRQDGPARQLALAYRYAQVRVHANAKREVALLEALNQVKLLYAQPKRSDSEYIYAMLEEVAFHYKANNQFALAEKTIEELRRYMPDAPFYRMKSAANLGVLRYDEKRYTESALAIQSALREFPSDSKSISLDMLLILQAELLMRNKDSKQALRNTQRVLARLTEQDSSRLHPSALSFESFGGKTSERHIEILLKAALVYRMMDQHDPGREWMQEAKRLYELAAEHFQAFYRKGRFNPMLNRLNKQIADGLLATRSNAASEQQTILQQIEINTSQHVWRKFLTRHVQSVANQANSIQELQLLQHEWDYWQQQPDSISQRPLAEIKSKRERINKQQSATAKSTFDRTTFHLASIQSKLSASQFILRFYVTDSSVYRADISASSIQIIHLGKIDSLRQIAKEYYHEIIQLKPGTQTTAEHLHALLLKSFQVKSNTQLIIIPEDFLSYIPFETLIGPDKKLLLTHHSISYSYTLPLWAAQQELDQPLRGKQVLAVAPRYPMQSQSNQLAKRGGFYHLPFAEQEATQLVSRYGGQLLQGNQASRQAFLQAINQYPILHLAMHARMDTMDYEQSAFIFQNEELLKLHELYQLDIKPQLVVLSACNTGMGKLEQGEGFMSLSRALTYAGAPSLIYSLWEVPDEETAFIMEKFYHYVQDGNSKDESLQRAKRDFIQSHPLKQHPYFWAGFVLNGNTKPLRKEILPSNWIWMLGGFLSFMLAVAVGWRKYQRGKASNNLAA